MRRAPESEPPNRSQPDSRSRDPGVASPERTNAVDRFKSMDFSDGSELHPTARAIRMTATQGSAAGGLDCGISLVLNEQYYGHASQAFGAAQKSHLLSSRGLNACSFFRDSE